MNFQNSIKIGQKITFTAYNKIYIGSVKYQSSTFVIV